MQDISLFIHQHSQLSLAFIVVFILLTIIEFIRAKRGTNQLSAAEATNMINRQDAVVVDVRSTESYATGHIVDAVSLPLADIATKYKKLEKSKTKPIILVCATGTDSPQASTTLSSLGFNTFILNGGIRAWRTAEMPVVKG